MANKAKPNGLAIANALGLKQCESRIQAAIDGAREHWAAIGRELVAIRDGGLYQSAGFETFEAYCLQRWEFTRAHAYRLMDAVKVIADLSPMGGAGIPATERQAREVGAAAPDPETRREVWEAAQEMSGNPQPAARVIRQAAEVVQTKTPINPESAEVTESVEAFQATVKLLLKRGRDIKAALEAKVAKCRAMESRKVKFERLVANMLGQVELLQEHINEVEKAWQATRRQVDEF